MIFTNISISPSGRRRARQQAKTANDRRHFPPGKINTGKKPETKRNEEMQLIGQSQEVCRGKRYIITIYGDPKTLEKLRKD